MSTKFNVRYIRVPSPQARAEEVGPIGLVFDGEDALCDEYIVVSREDDMPALQEYLQELRTD